MKALGWLVAGALVTGCQATHLVYVYDLSVGIDVAYSQEGTGKMVFGYDRGTYAIVPQKAARQTSEWAGAKSTEYRDDDGEIMSLAAVSGVRSKGLNELRFNHFIATGTAAEGVAEDSDGLAKIREAIFGHTGTTGAVAADPGTTGTPTSGTTGEHSGSSVARAREE